MDKKHEQKIHKEVCIHRMRVDFWRKCSVSQITREMTLRSECTMTGDDEINENLSKQ